MAVATLVLAGGASGADIGANDDTGKWAADGGAVFFTEMANLQLKQSVMTVRFDPTTPFSVPDLPALDRAIATAEAAGLQVVLAVYPFPPREIENGFARPAGFAAWLSVLASTHTAVKQYVVMNEPNQPAFLRPQFRADGRNASAALAGSFLAAAYDALKAVDPTITVIGLGLSPRGNDRPAAPNNVSTSPVRFLAALGRWYRATGRTRPLMDGLSFHPYPNAATDQIDQGYVWPNAGFADLGRIKQALWDAFRETAQPTTVDGLRLYLDEVGWQVDTTGLAGYAGEENVPVTDEGSQAVIYSALIRRSACDPQVAQLNFFGFYDDANRVGFQSALYRVDGTPRAAAGSVFSAIGETRAGCQDTVANWHPARRVVGAAATWQVVQRREIRVTASAAEGTAVIACILPGTLGGIAADAAMALRSAPGRGCVSAAVMPGRPVVVTLKRDGRLVPVTAAIRLVAESSPLRWRTFSRPLR